MNAAKLTTQRVSRINTLLNKMLSNAERSESCSSRSDSIDRIAQSTPRGDTAATAPVNPKLKRNLFGVSLNHDQLKQDLNSMWKEQIEVQKVKWNFDFEALKPIDSSSDRFKWTKCQVGEITSSKYASTLLTDGDHVIVDKENVNSNRCSDMPQFYKQQRCFKLIDNITPVVVKEDSELIKPKAVKSTKATKSLGLSQIITFSENRKDTLRSANTGNKVVKSSNSAFSAKKEDKKSDNMKQQSLLDMFKQRKRRIQTTSTPKPVASKDVNKDAKDKTVVLNLVYCKNWIIQLLSITLLVDRYDILWQF
ncbi:cyclin-dependent kinase inhibitor 1 isoform X2 [Brachionus plicatilis]|uniref:Cyclin-dependent kinase inhibitor 1 isoform X2 n=1 Tax=Brachionus plicatilis TaxID=10195 RepID=A0A3M7SWG6_BRAPC|nr:cyclin-dependent kinase inhibitor 1 isoform X2 [Brachionus plicatilis]